MTSTLAYRDPTITPSETLAPSEVAIAVRFGISLLEVSP